MFLSGVRNSDSSAASIKQRNLDPSALLVLLFFAARFCLWSAVGFSIAVLSFPLLDPEPFWSIGTPKPQV